MVFRVEIEPQAHHDIDFVATYLKEGGSLSVAERWFNSVMDDIASLKNMPPRCPIAPESKDLGVEVRHLLHGKRHRTYKNYFAIDYATPSTGIVRVFHVRHCAQKPLTHEDLEKLLDADISGGD
jgi:plasmid stabilization system protein ParE